MPRIPYIPDKDPDDIANYQISWADRLGATVLTSSTFTVIMGSCSISASAFTDTASQYQVTGGELWETCEIRNRVTTSGGETFDQTVLLRIRKR